MTNEERKVFELALDWIEKQPEETPDSKYDVNSRYVVLRELEAALAQPETPYEIGQRIAKTGGGISHLWSAVSQDDEIAEAERGFKEALAQPEQEPVANVVLRDGLPTLLANNQIKPTDERLYTAPPQRKPLTDEQKVALCKKFPDHLTFNAIKAIEAAHGIKE